MPGDCAGPLEEGKADGDFCAVRQREGELRNSDLSPFPMSGVRKLLVEKLPLSSGVVL